MKTDLQAGQVLDSGFEILEIVNLEELDAAGIWAKHQKSGAEVFHLLNDDPENLFSFSFATTPEDSTGAAHILEHSVLCGSVNYPLKDAFLVLAQGSLQTFLNAWTFPDKTLYPASSVNEHDYFNLMSVYGDAVFRPLLSEWTFMQEGHRLEFVPNGGGHDDEGNNAGLSGTGDSSSVASTDSNGTARQEKAEGLSITGVVYNEMKGAYSSLDAYAGLWSAKSVLPGTPYDFESGGDPQCIPDLSWEGLKEFHRTRYSPANCRIFLAGNIPTEKQLAFLNDKFLDALPVGHAAPPVPKAERWTAPRNIRVPCPGGEDTKPTVFLSWLCSDSTDAAETLALAALAETLLGHDGSPLTRTLIESGLGEDLSPVTGLDSELRETVFTVGLRGVGAGEVQVEALIMGELRRIASEGIPKEEIDAALLAMEFSHREIRRAGGPYSLVWLRRSLQGWLHGAKPWDSLLFVPVFTRLKACLAQNNRYFESLIQKYFLDNPHRALVVIEPEEGYLEKQEAALAASLAKREAALTEEERRAITEQSAELDRIQSAGEDPAALATIPHLSRKDLSPEIEVTPRELHDAAGVPVLTHGLFTNGITYVDIAFPLDVLAPEDYRWLPLFSRAVVSMGLPGMDYAAVSSLLARTTGGFHAVLDSGSPVPGTGAAVSTPGGILDLCGRDWIMYRLKALDEKTSASLDLARRLITEADFSDQRRLRDLVLEMKNEADSSLAPAGHSYASSRAGLGFSHSKTVEEIWNGLEQLNFVHTIANRDIAGISHTLTNLRDRIRAGGCIVNITASAEALPGSLRLIEDGWSRFGPPKPRNFSSQGIAPFLALLGVPATASSAMPQTAHPGKPSTAAHPATPKTAYPAKRLPEVFASPSLQVGFAALALPGASYTSRDHAAEVVLSHQLSTGALWEDIRMKGGAYGAFAHPDGIEEMFFLSTYRDPNPLRSLGAFGAVLQGRAGQKADEEALEKAVIGSYAKETRPRTAAERGSADFSRFLYGVDDRHRARKLQSLVDITDGELAAAAGRLAAGSSGAEAASVIIAGTGAAKEAAARLGVAVQELPV